MAIRSVLPGLVWHHACLTNLPSYASGKVAFVRGAYLGVMLPKIGIWDLPTSRLPLGGSGELGGSRTVELVTAS